MKKTVIFIFTLLSALSLTFFGNVNNISANDDNTYIDLPNDIEFIPDDVITDDMIKTGEDYAKKMSVNPLVRMDGELWEVTSSSTAISYGVVKAAFGDLVPVGESRTKDCGWSVSAGTKIKGFTLSVGVSGKKSIRQSGPSSSDSIAGGKAATHRAFFAVGYGRLVKYTYRVTQKYSGAYLRTEIRYIYADVSTESCSQLINLNGSTVTAENVNKIKTRSASLATYKAKFSSIDGTCLYYYKW